MRHGEQSDSFPVAVIGMQGVFPDAYDVDSFWQNQLNGHSTVRLIEEKRWFWQNYFGDSGGNEPKTTIRSACQIPNVDKFDHRFFGILPKEAIAMDPQQRLFLQAAVSALEDAGYSKRKIEGSDTSVFVGIGNADYPGMMNANNASFDMFKGTGLALSCIANRLSFWLDLHGPSESIDTACSGSLVAVHHAIEALRRGDSKLAIAGGTNIIAGPELFIAFEKAGMLSKTARCQTFDKDANGYVRGEGVAAIVLCPLEEAIRQGEYIYGVIEGAYINHGGRAHSLTAPNASSQADVIYKAWKRANKNLHEACLLETHGTGTPLGDPIEINGILKALQIQRVTTDGTESNTKIALGALKTHVGHLEATAGIAGLMKAILSLKNKCIPKNLNYTELNTHINLGDSPLYIPTHNTKLSDTTSDPLLAGISSFGFGGVNAHVVISSYSNQNESFNEDTAEAVLIPLSARDKNSLLARARQLTLFLKDSKHDNSDMHVLLNHVREALHLEENEDAQESLNEMTLHQLNLDSGDLFKMTESLSSLLDVELKYEDLISCLTIGDVCESVRLQKLNAEKIATFDGHDYVTSQPSIPEYEKQTISLSEIAYNLTEGRDQYKIRVCFIVKSKQELLEKLYQFIDQPDYEDMIIVQNSSQELQLNEKPTNISDYERGTWLREWANWWLSDVGHLLDWNSVYQGQRQPRKIPLPSYPFEQVRSWYESTKETSNPSVQDLSLDSELSRVESTESDKNIVSKEKNTAYSFLEENMDIAITSLNCLASLFDYALYKAKQQHLTLKNIQLGQPIGHDDKQLVFADVLANGKRLFVCAEKHISTHDRILAGAYIQSEEGNVSFSGNKDTINPDTLLFDEISVQTKIDRLVSSSPYINSHSVKNGVLSFSITIPGWGPKKSAFWSPIIHMIIGCKNVLGDTTSVYYPCHIERADLYVQNFGHAIEQLKVWQQSGKTYYSFRSKAEQAVLELAQVTYQKMLPLNSQKRSAS
nr:polyketide synthase [uncultured Methylophaga sp.]